MISAVGSHDQVMTTRGGGVAFLCQRLTIEKIAMHEGIVPL
jgi:hypothetical protein